MKTKAIKEEDNAVLTIVQRVSKIQLCFEKIANRWGWWLFLHLAPFV